MSPSFARQEAAPASSAFMRMRAAQDSGGPDGCSCATVPGPRSRFVRFRQEPALAFGPSHPPSGRGHADRAGARESGLAAGIGWPLIRRCGRADRGSGRSGPCTRHGPLRADPLRARGCGGASAERRRGYTRGSGRGGGRTRRGKPGRCRRRFIDYWTGTGRGPTLPSSAGRPSWRRWRTCGDGDMHCSPNRHRSGIPFTRRPRALHGGQEVDAVGSRGSPGTERGVAASRGRGVRGPRPYGPDHPPDLVNEAIARFLERA